MKKKGLSLKNPAQMLWPNAKRTAVRPRRIESRRVTNMVCLPFSGLLTHLTPLYYCLVCYETNGGDAVQGSN